MELHARKGKGKGKGGKATSSSTSVCWSCGKTRHVASNCRIHRVSAVDGEDQLGTTTKVLTLVSLMIGPSGPNVRSTLGPTFTTTATIGIRLGMIHFGSGILEIPGILGVGLRTFLRNLGLWRPPLRRRPKL